MSCAATVGRFLPLDSVHELYRHNPYPRYRSCLAALRRCSSWSMLIIRRKEGHAADPSCHRRLFAHAHQPAICRFMSVEIKKHPANGLSSCPLGFCCACFMPLGQTNRHLSSDSSLLSRISSVVCGGEAKQTTATAFQHIVIIPHVCLSPGSLSRLRGADVVVYSRLAVPFIGIVLRAYSTNCFSLHVRSPFHKTFTVSLQLTPLHARTQVCGKALKSIRLGALSLRVCAGQQPVLAAVAWPQSASRGAR